jgi:ATP-dependent DNA helicase Rep
LEFPYVFMTGMEEGLLPHRASLDAGSLEEERRLAYVGITRAQRGLALTFARQRLRMGEAIDCEPSRFLEELPSEHLEWDDPATASPEAKRESGRASLAHLQSLLEGS